MTVERGGGAGVFLQGGIRMDAEELGAGHRLRRTAPGDGRKSGTRHQLFDHRALDLSELGTEECLW